MLANILLLVIDAAAGFLTLMLLARFYMQWQRISFRNQLGQFVVSTTDWIVRPLRRFIPGMFGLDMASLLPAWVVQVLLVRVRAQPARRGVQRQHRRGDRRLGGVGLIELLRMMVYLLFAVVLGSAVLSWVSPHSPLAPAAQCDRGALPAAIPPCGTDHRQRRPVAAGAAAGAADRADGARRRAQRLRGRRCCSVGLIG
jgi:YggT family protein